MWQTCKLGAGHDWWVWFGAFQPRTHLSFYLPILDMGRPGGVCLSRCSLLQEFMLQLPLCLLFLVCNCCKSKGETSRQLLHKPLTRRIFWYTKAARLAEQNSKEDKDALFATGDSTVGYYEGDLPNRKKPYCLAGQSLFLLVCMFLQTVLRLHWFREPVNCSLPICVYVPNCS